MAKQPYIPFYIGDYIKDTRKLPLAVRGAWVDLLLYMWDEPVKGEITGTIEEFSGMLSCTTKECEFALNLLMEKKVCNYEKLPGAKIKIISRRMKKDADISLKRSKSGSKGVKEKAKLKQKKEFVVDLPQAKSKQNPDIEYIYDNDTGLNSFEGEGNFSFSPNTELPKLALEAVEMNQFTHTKKKNTDFVKEQWRTFLSERINDPPAKKSQYKILTDLTSYFFNWMRDKFPTNGTHQHNSSYGTKLGTSEARINTAKEW